MHLIAVSFIFFKGPIYVLNMRNEGDYLFRKGP